MPLWDRLQPGKRHLPHRKSEGVRSGVFRAKASPTGGPRRLCGIGCSRQGVRCHTAKVRVFDPASSRLKPVPLEVRGAFVELAVQQGKRQRSHRKSEGVRSGLFPAKASPTGGPRCFVGPVSAGKASAVTPQK